MSDPVLVAVTDHAVERYRQRVDGGSGSLDVRPDIVARVSRAWSAGSIAGSPPDGADSSRGSVYVRDLGRSDLLYVCRHDRPRGELVVVTLWEEGDAVAVPRRYTDALRTLDRRPRLRPRDANG